jgi:hypothetical protein
VGTKARSDHLSIFGFAGRSDVGILAVISGHPVIASDNVAGP